MKKVPTGAFFSVQKNKIFPQSSILILEKYLTEINMGRKWTKEEEQYLAEQWGTVSVTSIAQRLNRSEHAVTIHKNRMGIGAFLESGDYITWNQFLLALGYSNGSDRINAWVKNRNFPLRTKRVNKNVFKVVYLDEWWAWADEYKSFIDFSRFEENVLGEEPEWVKEKRKNDFLLSCKYTNAPWTKQEEEHLKRLVASQKYTVDEISKMIKRTCGAIQRRLVELNIKDRPIKADNHTLWTDAEFYQLGEMIKAGYNYELIAERLGKSSKACRGRVYSMYLTENLDKARKIMGNGDFGANRPIRTIKQYRTMNTEERIEVKDAATRLTAILHAELKRQLKETNMGDFFQKDMCENYSAACLSGEGCDLCRDFKRIRSQACKMCGKTFWEKEESTYCAVCRDMRKKQWLRKRFILDKRGIG